MQKSTPLHYLCLLIICLIGFAPKAKAHPHVFIDASISMTFGEDSIDHLLITYAFDYMFSTDLTQRFDLDKSAAFNDAEVESIRQEAFSNLSQHSYFIHIIDDDRIVNIDTVSHFKAHITTEGIVQYTFVVSPKISTAPKFLKIAVYDDTYYMDVQLLEKNVTFEKDDNIKYLWEVYEDEDMAYYYDQIYPTCLTLFIN